MLYQQENENIKMYGAKLMKNFRLNITNHKLAKHSFSVIVQMS